MGGVNIVEDMIIDKSIHQSINSRSAVLKVLQKYFVRKYPVKNDITFSYEKH